MYCIEPTSMRLGIHFAAGYNCTKSLHYANAAKNPNNAAHGTSTLLLSGEAALSKPRFEFELEPELVAAALVLVELLEREIVEPALALVLPLEVEVVLGLALPLSVLVLDCVLTATVVDEALPQLLVTADPDAAFVDDDALPAVVLVTIVRTPLLVARLYTPSARLNEPLEPSGRPSGLANATSSKPSP